LSAFDWIGRNVQKYGLVVRQWDQGPGIAAVQAPSAAQPASHAFADMQTSKVLHDEQPEAAAPAVASTSAQPVRTRLLLATMPCS
jgi:hypothetical protein